jgi:putative hemolysin
MSDHLLPIPWLDVLLVLALIVLNGVLSMGELAIVSSREARLKASASTRCGPRSSTAGATPAR